MRTRIGTALLLLAAGLAACGKGSAVPVGNGSGAGTVGVGGGTASGTPRTVTPQPNSSGSSANPTATVTTAPGAKVVVTESDSGKTYVLHVGQTLEVRLPSEYVPPTSNGGSVLVRTSTTGGYPSGRPVDAFFRADSRGRADVSSSTDYACLHATPRCGVPQRLWVVHVIVGGS